MHHSMLSSIIIDCDDYEAGVNFWGQALGLKVFDTEPDYTFFEKHNNLYIGIQRVTEGKSSKSRVHFDIMADDVEAEVHRLEGLGARRLTQVETWQVMQDPCGNEFCVVRASRSDFAEHAHAWQ